MGENTAISWCHHTFNAWWGCFKISPGCANCYAATFDKRVGGKNWERTGPRRFFGEKHWKEPMKWAAKARAAGVRERVFCSSMADIFERHPDDAVNAQMDEFRRRLGELVRATEDALDWLFLTKRPENFGHMLPMIVGGTVAPNVWLGVTVEDQEHARKRIPILLSTPAAIRFLSCEPLLGELDLLPWFDPVGACDCTAESGSHCEGGCEKDASWRHAESFEASDPEFGDFDHPSDPQIHWVIAGCESGPRARACEVDWLRTLRDQCAKAGVAFLLKQAVESFPIRDEDPRIVGYSSDPPPTAEVLMGDGSKRKARGVIELPYLDGVQHAEFPNDGPHDRLDCPCGHPPGTRGACGGCNCADDPPDELDGSHAQDGELEIRLAKPMMLLPPHPSACQTCGRKHDPEQPHDATSLYWQTKRHMDGLPPPTWKEAMEHCDPAVKDHWTRTLTELGEKLQ